MARVTRGVDTLVRRPEEHTVSQRAGRPRTADSRSAQPPGHEADSPVQIPPRGWWQVTRRAFAECKADHVPMLAGGVAFFAFLAVFPALIAALTLYGLVADPGEVARQVEGLARAPPPDAPPLIAHQLRAVAPPSGGGLGLG